MKTWCDLCSDTGTVPDCMEPSRPRMVPCPSHVRMPVLGIDIGGVIIDGHGADTDFLKVYDDERAMQAVAMAGVFETVARLVKVFDGRAWIVSKCGLAIQRKSAMWLRHHRFFERTGLPESNVRYCLKRPEKSPICKDLGITHFIDDREDVLGFMSSTVPHRFLFRRDWAATEADVLRSLVELLQRQP